MVSEDEERSVNNSGKHLPRLDVHWLGRSISNVILKRQTRMKMQEKLHYLQEHHFNEWLKMRREVEDELSARQSMFCVCGRLATGLHESGCRRFSNKVTSETVKRLKHLIPKEAAIV